MPGVDLADVLYEITSAGATVGLSRGLTPQLNVAGKWIRDPYHVSGTVSDR